MRAAVQTRFGAPEVVEIRELPEPVARHDELLVEVRATTVTSGDSRLRAMRMPRGLLGGAAGLIFRALRSGKNKVLGIEFAGVVRAAGAKVTRFKVGDEVFGATGMTLGAHAEMVRVRESGMVALKPDGLTFDESAAVAFGGSTALYYLRDLAKVQQGQRVLVIGASGCVGLFALQMARHFGAEVVGVCSGANAALVREMGAARVIDYATEDFTREREVYDVVFDCVESTSFGRCRAALKPRGMFLPAVMSERELWQMLWTKLVGGKRVRGGIAPTRKSDLEYLRGLLEEGRIRAVIGRRFAFEEIVEAHRYVDSGRKVGAAVVRVGVRDA